MGVTVHEPGRLLCSLPATGHALPLRLSVSKSWLPQASASIADLPLISCGRVRASNPKFTIEHLPVSSTESQLGPCNTLRHGKAHSY